MMKLSCHITGDDYILLKNETPESRKKVSALASVIFVPVAIWIATGYLMVSCVLNGSSLTAWCVAAFLGFLIFLIEKNIIMAPSSPSVKRFRYTLGVVIALLGAVFLDEVVLKPDIDQELFMMNKETITAKLQMLEGSYNTELASSLKDVATRHSIWQQALTDANHEADGSGGSGIKGVNAIAKMKLASAEICKSDYDQAVVALADLKTKISTDKADLQRQIQNSFKDGALLIRIKALFRLVFSDIYMAIIYLLLTVFLFSMEFLVVFLKGAWPKTNYERKVELIEEIGRKRMERLGNYENEHFVPYKFNSKYRHLQSFLKESGSPSLFN